VAQVSSHQKNKLIFRKKLQTSKATWNLDCTAVKVAKMNNSTAKRQAKRLKARPLLLYAKAVFRHHGKTWTSDVAWVLVLYRPSKGDIVFLHRWCQKAKEAPHTSVKPHFPAASKERLLSIAKERYEDGYTKRHPSNATTTGSTATLKGHCQGLCEMCIERKRPCISHRR